MKKIALLACGALIMGVTSCNKESEPINTQTITIETYSLVSKSGSAPVVAPTTYKYYSNLTAMTTQISTEDLSTGTGVLKFQTDMIPFIYGYNISIDKEKGHPFRFMKAADAGGTPTPVTKLRCDLTECTNANNKTLIGSLENQLKANPLLVPANKGYSFMQYTLGEYDVKTFWPDMLYTGSTMTQYPGDGSPYENENITYRVKMNLSKADNYTADVFFYNAKFAEKAPAVNFVLKDLPLKFSLMGFEISAENVDPVMVPENTPNTRFRFDSFKLLSTPGMDGMTCRYKVAGIYEGEASGMFLYPVQEK